jgi:peroxiredoxin
VSVDSWASAAAYRAELGLDFTLLSDWGREVSPAWGAWNPQQQVSTRWSYLIDKQGIIQFAQHSALSEPRDLEAMLAAVRALAEDAPSEP